MIQDLVTVKARDGDGDGVEVEVEVKAVGHGEQGVDCYWQRDAVQGKVNIKGERGK